jgi:hypothetical protein
MKRYLTGIALLFVLTAFAQPKTPSGVSIQLRLQSDEGTNGCAVAWNPKQKLYYTIIAGNEIYPIDIFDERGTWKNQKQSGVDARGLWYNSKSGKLGGRSFAGDLVEWNLSSSGEPQNFVVTGSIDMEGQQVTTLGAKGTMYVYKEGTIVKYSAKGKEEGSVILEADFNEETHNTYSMGFTGVKNYEFVLVNLTNTALEFFNLKGKRTATVNLPGEVPYAENFQFSFANNHVWLYDIDTRTWSGYKVF